MKKETSKYALLALYGGKSTVTGGFPHKGPLTRKCFHVMTSSYPLTLLGPWWLVGRKEGAYEEHEEQCDSN